MHAPLFFAAMVALVAPTLSAVLPVISKREAGLKVELKQKLASSIEAVMTNTGGESLKLLDFGTLMDKNPVQKLNVFKDGIEVDFTGIDARYKMSDFPEDAFTTLAPGESFTSVINMASLHDIQGGDYTVSANGAIPYAAPGTTDLAGSVRYASNVLPITLTEEEVALVPRAVPVLDKRTLLAACQGQEASEHVQSIGQVVNVAAQAALAARAGDPEVFGIFFKTTSNETREYVAQRFDAISAEASSQTGGKTTYQCEDQLRYCSDNTLAYALPSQNLIANCPLYYTISSLSRECGDQDQTTTALHEFTHTPGVFSPPTQDFAYGFYASQSLSAERAFLNADTYALYANAVINSCGFRPAS